MSRLSKCLLLFALFLFSFVITFLLGFLKEGRTEKLFPSPFPYNAPLPLKKSPGDYKNTKLFIFISSSMPEGIIRQYIKDTEEIKESVVFVLRGFVKNSTNIIETVKYVRDLLCEDSEDENTCYNRAVDVNPGLFSLFRIKLVPAFVVIEGKDEISGCISEEETPPFFYLSYGDAVLSYHLSRMSRAGSKEAEKLLRKLKNSYWD